MGPGGSWAAKLDSGLVNNLGASPAAAGCVFPSFTICVSNLLVACVFHHALPFFSCGGFLREVARLHPAPHFVHHSAAKQTCAWHALFSLCPASHPVTKLCPCCFHVAAPQASTVATATPACGTCCASSATSTPTTESYRQSCSAAWGPSPKAS